MEQDTFNNRAARINSLATVNTVEQEKIITGNHSYEDDHVPLPRTKAQRLRAHVMRHKWLYIAFAILQLIMVVLTPITFAVVIPLLISKAINSNKMPIKAASVGVISSHMVRVGLTTELTNPRGETVSLDAALLDLYNPQPEAADAPPTMLSVQFPPLMLKGHTTIPVTVAPQEVQVQSETELRAFLARAYADEAAAVGVRGTVRTHLGALGYNIALDKTVQVAGLAGLRGMRVATLLPTPPPRGGPANANSTLNGTMVLPNPSALTLDMGDVRYRVSSNGVFVGTSWTNSLHVVPGTQNLDYQGELYVDKIADKADNFTNFKKIAATVDDDGRVHFDIVGDRSYIDGKPIEYLDDVIKLIQLDVAPCMTAAAKGLPTNKQYFQMGKFYDYFGAAADCDVNAPLT